MLVRLRHWTQRELLLPLLRRQYRRHDLAGSGPAHQLVLYHHLGLGDHIICYGLVCEIIARLNCRQLYLAVKPDYATTVAALYRDVPAVNVLPVDPLRADSDVYGWAKTRGCPVLRVGFERVTQQHWDASFYVQAGVDFSASWDRLANRLRAPAAAIATPDPPALGPRGRDAPLEDEDRLFAALALRGAYCLVHTDSSDGAFALRLETPLPVVHITPQPYAAGLLAWCRVIREAAEIHCIDSSVIHLVDRMPDLQASRLVFHDARKTGKAFTTRKAWSRVDYP